jgi:hypothetical protein
MPIKSPCIKKVLETLQHVGLFSRMCHIRFSGRGCHKLGVFGPNHRQSAQPDGGKEHNDDTQPGEVTDLHDRPPQGAAERRTDL